MIAASILFAVLNSVFRLAVTAILIYKLFNYRESFNEWEKAGMSIAAGTCFLTIPVIFDIDKTGTPMDGWAGTAFTFGIMIYFIGRMKRLHAHAVNNEAMNRQAREHLDRRDQ
jgi:hypothetical protein